MIFDESSASLNRELDEKLQLVIREEFRASVVLTIAHRLQVFDFPLMLPCLRSALLTLDCSVRSRTIIDYDRVLVLDAGRIVEDDTPRNLLARRDGVFKRIKCGTLRRKALQSRLRIADSVAGT